MRLGLLPFFFFFLCASSRPIVVWHGLGDSYASPGMLEFVELVKEQHPGVFVHSVYLDKDLKKDREAGFYGHVMDQLESVAEQLAAVAELQDGFDAIGFSQGGQFLRAYVEIYNSPPVHNLITFGAQHMGVSDIPACRKYDVLCQIARRATKAGVYSQWAQQNLVQAQYFRDPAQLETYLATSEFLAIINNEVPESRNSTFSTNLASLNSLILVIFTEDLTVVPKESSWFGAEVITDSRRRTNQQVMTQGRAVIPMREHAIYKEDWIGLKQLDNKGGLVFEICEGEHMQIGECWKRIIQDWCGGRD